MCGHVFNFVHMRCGHGSCDVRIFSMSAILKPLSAIQSVPIWVWKCFTHGHMWDIVVQTVFCGHHHAKLRTHILPAAQDDRVRNPRQLCPHQKKRASTQKCGYVFLRVEKVSAGDSKSSVSPGIHGNRYIREHTRFRKHISKRHDQISIQLNFIMPAGQPPTYNSKTGKCMILIQSSLTS